jgi:hypothetical protein
MPTTITVRTIDVATAKLAMLIFCNVQLMLRTYDELDYCSRCGRMWPCEEVGYDYEDTSYGPCCSPFNKS